MDMANLCNGDSGNPENGSPSWLERVTARVCDAQSPTAIIGTRQHGVNQIVAEIASLGNKVAWVQFDAFDVGDSESQGSKLADGVTRAFQASVVGHGLPVDYTMQVVARVCAASQPVVFAFSEVQYAREAMASIRYLDAAGVRILVFGASESDVEPVKPRALITTEELLLRDDELEASCPKQLGVPGSILREIATDSRRCFLPFLVECSSRAGLPPVIVPEPTGASIEGPGQDVVNPVQLVEALLRRGAAAEALELAIRSQVPLSDGLVSQGAESLTTRGLHKRLFAILESVGWSCRMASAEVMKWYFASATSVNKHNDVKAEVLRFLESREAPELRALYAAAFPGPDLLEESRAALEALETPLTLRIHAFALSQVSSGNRSADLLWRAMRQAEALGLRDQVMACATDLADYWIKRGGYRDAQEWSRWALSYHEQHSLRDELRRLVAVGLGSFARILSGETSGLGATVEGMDVSSSGVPTSETLISTRADWCFLSGDVREAADLYALNLRSASFGQFHHAAVDLIHALVNLGSFEEAQSIAMRARALARGEGGVATAIAELAYGLANMYDNPEDAIEALEFAQGGLMSGIEAHKLAQASIALAVLRLRGGDVHEALQALQRGEQGVRELGASGWALLGGFHPEVETARKLFRGDAAALGLSFLGDDLVQLDGMRVQLGTRHCELLAILALYPKGLSAEELGEMLYGDRLNISSLKAAVSRLRKRVPISSKPYMLQVPLRADFLLLERCLSSNRIRDALALYRGPLLPKSQSPEVVEWREHLEEMLRRSVLSTGDPDLVLQFARVVEHDLEVVEACVGLLSADDPRLPVAEAMRARIVKSWTRSD